MNTKNKKIIVEQPTFGKSSSPTASFGGTSGNSGGASFGGTSAKSGGASFGTSSGSSGGASFGKGSNKKDEKPKDDKSSGKHPENQAEGDAFREWMSVNHSDFRCGSDKLENKKNMSFTNFCIKDAWGQFGKSFKEKSGTSTGGTSKHGEFPINTVDLSNMFREWVYKYRNDYASKHTELERKISDPKKNADTALKLAWARFSQEYIDFLKTRLNDKLLMSTGSKLEKSNNDWETSDSALEIGTERILKDEETELKKCEPWTKGNSIEKEVGRTSFSSVKNDMAKRFVEWINDEGMLDRYVPENFCNTDTFNTDWVEEKYTYNNVDNEPYQHPLLKLLATVKTTTKNTKGETIPVRLFEKFLRESGKDVNVKKDISLRKSGIPSLNSPSETWAETIITAGPNKPFCVGLRNSLSLTFESGSEMVKKAIGLCNSKNSSWLDKSLKGKVKTKLGVFQENKMIKESIENKLKLKKTEKTLISLSEDFNKQNYKKFFEALTKFKKNKNINESTNTEFEKSFDVIFKGKETEFKNRAIEYILNKLEVSPTSDLGKNIKSELDNIPAKDMFKNEYDVPEAISKAVELSSQSNTEEQKGLKGIVSKSVKFDDKQIKQGVRQHLHDYIEGVKDDIKSLEQKLKSSIMKDI